MTGFSHDPWRVRVSGADGVVHGAGVLVAPDLVVTCAHVVAGATRAAETGSRPRTPVVVDFPTVESVGRLPAHVTDEGWVAVRRDNTGDLALLRLDRPTTVPPATLAHCGRPSERSVRVFGHPGGQQLGRWATVQLAGTAGPAGEWVQVHAPSDTAGHFGLGFSGAGMVDLETDAVIGLLVAVDRHRQARGAWMLTVEACELLLPALGGLILPDPVPALPVDSPPSYPDELVQALLDLDGIADRSRRDELVTTVERLLDRPLGARRSDRVHPDLLAIVASCLRHPVPNAIGRLVDAASRLYGEAEAVRRLAGLAARDPGRRLTHADVERLRTLVAAAPHDEVAAASRAAFGPLGPRVDLDPGNHAEIVRALSELMGGAGESPPLLAFLQLLAERLRGPAAEHLREWVRHIAERWQIPPDELSTPVRHRTLPAPSRSFLVIELREDGPTDRYLMSIWLQHDNGDGRALFIDDEQPLAIDEIPGYLGLHLRQVTSGGSDIAALTIEFVLPYQLLGYPVDQIRLMLDSGPVAIGAAHPVVVRSFDRIHNPTIRHRWQTRWRWLTQHRDTPDARAISWVRVEGGGRHTLGDALARDPDGYSEEYPVCLVLGFPSRGTGSPGGALRDAIERGMPVLVWCRLPKAADQVQFLADMANQLNGRSVGEVPEVVQRIRRDATLPGRPANHPGRRISLLWDDADRPPPSSALREPA